MSSAALPLKTNALLTEKIQRLDPSFADPTQRVRSRSVRTGDCHQRELMGAIGRVSAILHRPPRPPHRNATKKETVSSLFGPRKHYSILFQQNIHVTVLDRVILLMKQQHCRPSFLRSARKKGVGTKLRTEVQCGTIHTRPVYGVVQRFVSWRSHWSFSSSLAPRGALLCFRLLAYAPFVKIQSRFSSCP